MATRFYLPSSGTSALNPAWSTGWNDTSNASPLKLNTSTSKASTSMLDKSVTDATSTDVHFACGMWISKPLAAQTIVSQTVGVSVRTAENAAACNMHIHWVVRLLESDGATYRGDIVSFTEDTTEVPTTTGSAASRYDTAVSTEQIAQAGDRIVFEIGLGGDPTSTNPHNSFLKIGDNAAADLDAADADTGIDNPWLNFGTTTLVFGYGLTVDVGTYAITGVSANLKASRKIIPDVGSYSYTGAEVTLTKGVSAKTLAVDVGSYSQTGVNATLSFVKKIIADIGNYSVNGVSVSLKSERKLTGNIGSYSITGIKAVLTINPVTDILDDFNRADENPLTSVNWDGPFISGKGVWKLISNRTVPTSSSRNYWYVDNAVSSSGNGESWATAWKNFSDISWGDIQPGDILYISGGATSKTYYETLQPAVSGTNINFIIIDIGANSPSPSGHDGTVIIDSQNTRDNGILLTGSNSYIRINGRDSGGNYKFEIRNCPARTTIDSSSKAVIRQYNGNYIYLDYLKLPDITSFGISLDNSDNSRIRGCNITSLDSSSQYWINGIYEQYCENLIIEDNVLIMNHSPIFSVAGDPYGDCIQCFDATNLTFRNNYVKWTVGKGNAGCGGIMTDVVRGTSYYYNNIVIGCQYNDAEMMQFEAIGTGSLYLYNNTIIGTNTSSTMKCIHFNNAGDESNIGAIKNNIITSPNGLCMVIELGLTTSKSNYNCFNTTNEHIVQLEGGIQESWTEWQTAGYDPNGMLDDPDMNSADEYRLNSTSPCRNSGTDLLAYFTTDKDGKTRPIGAGWDIGAYEYG